MMTRGCGTSYRWPFFACAAGLFIGLLLIGVETFTPSIATGTVKEDAIPRDEVYAICTMIGDTIIRATINPLDSGEIPYHAVPWQRRPGARKWWHFARRRRAPPSLQNTFPVEDD